MLKTLCLSVFFVIAPAAADEATHPLPLPQQDVPAAGSLQTAVFAGGCFWGMQGVFQHVKGVREVKLDIPAGKLQPRATRLSSGEPPVMPKRCGSYLIPARSAMASFCGSSFQ